MSERGSAEVELNGKQPNIVGSACEGLVAVEYWHAGVLIEPANVVFLRFSSKWHRFTIDGPVLFWRTDTQGPVAFAADEIDAKYLPVDLGTRFRLNGAILQGIFYRANENTVGVDLRFDNGGLLRFVCQDDVTTFRYDP